jgi:hypothetical protein
MDRWGEVMSPDSGSPGIPHSTLEDSEQQAESFSKDQIDEIEQLLSRIGATDDTDVNDLLNEAHKTANKPSATSSTNGTHVKAVPLTTRSRYSAAFSEKEQIWKTHIKDVQKYLEAKKSTTTRAILHERQHKKQAHLTRPWKCVSPVGKGPSLLEGDQASPSEFIVEPTDMKSFITSRSI